MHRSKKEVILDFLIGKDKNKPELTIEEKMLHVTCRMAKKQANVFFVFWLSFWLCAVPMLNKVLPWVWM